MTTLERVEPGAPSRDERVSVRRWVNRVAESLFREEERTRSGWWALAVPLALVVASGLTYARVGRANGILWAEDGAVFFPAERSRGYLHVLFQGFQGYLHLLPRTLVLIASAFPLRHLATEYSICCAVTTGLVAVLTTRALAAYGVGRWGGLALGMLIPLTPIALFECLDVVCNIQWLLAGGCFWALLWAPRERRWLVASSVLVFVTVGSAPLTLVYVPLAILRLVALKGRQRSVPVAYLGGAVIQVWTMLHTDRVGIVHPTSFVDVIETVAARLYTVTWLGVANTQDLFASQGWATLLMVGLLWLLIIVSCSLTSRSRWLLVSSAVGATALFLAGTYNNYTSAVVGGSRGHVFNIVVTGRYANSPSFILASGSICALVAASRKSRWVLPVLGVAVIALSASVARDFHYVAPRQGSPNWEQSFQQAAAKCVTKDPSAIELIGAAPISAYDVPLSCKDILADH